MGLSSGLDRWTRWVRNTDCMQTHTISQIRSQKSVDGYNWKRTPRMHQTTWQTMKTFFRSLEVTSVLRFKTILPLHQPRSWFMKRARSMAPVHNIATCRWHRKLRWHHISMKSSRPYLHHRRIYRHRSRHRQHANFNYLSKSGLHQYFHVTH